MSAEVIDLMVRLKTAEHALESAYSFAQEVELSGEIIGLTQEIAALNGQIRMMIGVLSERSKT